MKDLHTAILRLPCDDGHSETYKMGHRDARHAAAELAIAAPVQASSDLIDEAWYWVRNEGIDGEYGPWTPAQCKLPAKAFYSVRFSGIPINSVIVGAELSAPQSQPADSNPNAEWLTTAHLICAEAGIAPGHISERLTELRDRLSAQPAIKDAAELGKAELLEMWLEAGRRAYAEDDGEAHEFFYQAVLASQKARHA